MIATEHRAALTAIVGEKGIVGEAGDMQRYEIGARYDKGRAALVLRPQSTDECSAAVAYCVSHDLSIIPQSGNTGLVSGSTPDATGTQTVVSLDRLTDTFELDTDNRSLKVACGTRLSDINSRLEPHGLFFPVDLSADPCIGGMISTNTGGSRFLRYGDVRRNILALEVVMADSQGTILSLGSEVRKNNTGVDWKQLFVGTSGAFGIVTHCVLNLEPLPRQTATAYLVPKDSRSIMPLLAAMEVRLGSYLSAFEGMSANAINAALAHVPSLRNPFSGGTVPDYVILAEISRSWEARAGEQSLDAALEAVLAEIWESADAPLLDAFVGPPSQMWALRHALSEGVKNSGRLIAFDLGFRRGDVMAFREHMFRELPRAFRDVSICDFGHVGDGGLHFNLVVKNREVYSEDFEARLRDYVVSIAVNDFGGSFSAEHAIGRKNQNYYDQFTDEKIKQMAAGLKPITSPGRLGSVRFG